jgi:hypothetical protein
MKLLTFALLLFSVLGWARAATRPLPGEYTGEWRARIDLELPAAVRTVHVTISTNLISLLIHETMFLLRSGGQPSGNPLKRVQHQVGRGGCQADTLNDSATRVPKLT